MARFDDVAIYTDHQFRTKLNYVHNNPVKAGLVTSPELYPFSSARAWYLREDDGLTDTTLGLPIDEPSGRDA
ncbi:MAG: hypothetical protein AB1644_06970 [Candidatus Zixiibacteriota bacterium]